MGTYLKILLNILQALFLKLCYFLIEELNLIRHIALYIEISSLKIY